MWNGVCHALELMRTTHLAQICHELQGGVQMGQVADLNPQSGDLIGDKEMWLLEWLLEHLSPGGLLQQAKLLRE